MPDTYICALCGGTFERGRPKEEAAQEAAETWGMHPDDWPAEEVAEICDPCYRLIALEQHPELVAEVKAEIRKLWP